MADLPSRVDLFAAGRRALLTTPNQRINPSAVNTEGSDINLIVGAAALMGEEVVAALAGNLLDLYVQTAVGSALDRVAFDRYGILRFPATAATVDLTLTRPTAVAGAGTLPAGLIIQTASGVQFALDNDVVFGALDLAEVGAATALLTGPDGNVSLGTVVQFADSPFDTTIQVINPAGAAGGSEAETDNNFRGRIRGFYTTLRRGTLGAIEFGGLTVPGITVARAVEVENICDGIAFPACSVDLIVADANGNASEALLGRVREALLAYRAAGIPVRVLGGLVTYEDVIWAVTYQTATNTQSLREQLRASTVAVAQALRPGETLYRSALISVARAIPGIIVGNDALREPAGDVTPPITQQNKLIRIRPQDVSFV